MRAVYAIDGVEQPDKAYEFELPPGVDLSDGAMIEAPPSKAALTWEGGKGKNAASLVSEN